MLKRFCDRCGKEIEKDSFYRIVIVERKDLPLMHCGEEKDWCKDCKEEIFGKDEQNDD